MLEALRSFFSSEGYMPHGHCYLWDRSVLWLHILSDAGIVLAYFSIPIILLYFVRQRKDIPYPWMFFLFGAFILACGATHLVGIYTIWNPEYALEGSVKAVTAVLSLATAVLLIPLVPKALALQGPAELEQRVNERTAELEQLNAALRQSEERVRLAIEAAPNGMIMVNAEGNIVLINSEIEKMFGYQRDEILGHEIGQLIPERFREKHPAYRQSYFENPQNRAMGAGRDLFGRRKDGTEFPVEIGLNPLVLDEGTYVLAAVVDITERKQAEAELTSARDTAETASLAKSDFLANMSHEIRTPLNGVFGMLGLLIDTKLSETQREYAETARVSAEALLRLINDILDFSRIEAGRLDIEPVAFDFQHAVEEAADMLAERADEKDIDLLVRYAPDLPRYFVGDPGRIRQVLTNLVSNAIKFTEQGHVLISVSEESSTRLNARIRVEVSDSGIGIAEDRHAEIFEKFSQQDSSATRKFGGAGLGLTISRELVELMGGEIGLSSQVGEGSTFWFTLDLPLQTDAPDPPAPPQSLEGVRVLVVDDNEINRRIVFEQLSRWGMRDETFSSGAAALEGLRLAHQSGDPYRVAIVDHRMPEMDGLEFGRRVKADPDLQDTILVLLTSTGLGNDVASVRKSGFDGYLIRPAHASRLMEVLDTLWTAKTRGSRTGLVTRRSLAEPSSRDGNRRSGAAGGQKPRILVAEDNPVNQLVAVRILEALGCQADVAADGVEALQMVNAAPYDLLFMDCQMPEMDGYEATREIRNLDSAASAIPIIAMTAHALEGEREKCLAAGMNDYLSKPVLLEDLEALLDAYLPEQASEESPPVKNAAAEGQYLDQGVVDNLKLISAGDKDFPAQLIKQFRSQFEAAMVDIEAAIAAHDYARLGEIAHAMKGACSNIGASHMAGLCVKLEKNARSGTADLVQDVVAQLRVEFEQVSRRFLAAFRQD